MSVAPTEQPNGSFPKPAYERFADWLAAWSLRLCHLLLLTLLILTLTGVFFRYLLVSPLAWSEELARYLLIWLSLLGAGVVTRRREEVRLTAVVRHFPPEARLLTELTLRALVVVFLSVIFYYSLRMLVSVSSQARATTLPVTMTWAHGSLAVGFLLIALQSLVLVAQDIHHLKSAAGRNQRQQQKGG